MAIRHFASLCETSFNLRFKLYYTITLCEGEGVSGCCTCRYELTDSERSFFRLLVTFASSVVGAVARLLVDFT